MSPCPGQRLASFWSKEEEGREHRPPQGPRLGQRRGVCRFLRDSQEGERKKGLIGGETISSGKKQKKKKKQNQITPRNVNNSRIRGKCPYQHLDPTGEGSSFSHIEKRKGRTHVSKDAQRFFQKKGRSPVEKERRKRSKNSWKDTILTNSVFQPISLLKTLQEDKKYLNSSG